MPSRSRHNRNHNNHSNRSSNKNRNRRDAQWQTNSTHSTKSESKSNLNTNSKKHIHVHSGSNCIDKSCKEEKACSLHEEENKCDTIDEFEEEILFELSHDSLSISELSQLFEKYVHRRNASALFLFRIICEWVSCEQIDLKLSSNLMNNNLLHHAETCDKIRNSLLKVLFGLTDKVTFKNITNQIAWALSVIKILSSGLPTLCTTLMHWMIKHVKSGHLSSNNIQRDELRFIVMFLRPEIVEQCAELVQFNASIFENVFRELVAALVDNYQPFRIWLFSRLCSKKRKLIEAQLATFICFGDEKHNEKKIKAKTTEMKTKRSKTWIVNEEESNDDCKEDHDEMNINRLMNAFKFCMNASNELVISNGSRTYYELGHLLLNEAISIANTLRYHFIDIDDNSFDAMLSIMHCNLGSIYLHENKYKEALNAANIALSYDINCIQSHRIRAEYYIKHARDTNSALTDLYEILYTDSDHPYAINTKKEIDAHLHNEAYICREIDTNSCTKTKRNRNIKPCARERHCAVSYRGDRLIIYGGCNLDSDANEILNDLWILDINNNRWMQLDTVGIIPSPRHSHCADIIQHKLYIIGGAKEIKKDINNNNNNDLISNNNLTTTHGGYALSGWFTNFFNKNDEKTINKIKELARKGIIDEDEDEDNEDGDDESDKSYYDICDFPAIEMLDLKHNKWIKPETTGTSPKQMMINAHSVCVGKKIFVFPNYDNDELQYFVLETDTLHWESFEIPDTHKILAADKNVIPVLYSSGDEDKILFVTPFNGNCTYYKHCLLFTKTMQWSPIRKIPCAQLTAYDRIKNKFAFTTYANYIIIHGGILKDKQEREIIKNTYNETQSCILSKLPSKNDMKYNVIDDIFNMFAMCDDEEESDDDDDSNESDESEDEESYDDDDDDDYHYNDHEYDLILSPLYTMNTNYDNVESRVSIVESLLFNKNPTEIHRIGPLNNNHHISNYEAYIDNSSALLPLYNISTGNKQKIIKRITTKTQIITTREGKTRRRKTITTQHTTEEEKDEKENEKELLCNLEIFDFVSMRWLPRIPLHHVSNNNNNEILHKFDNHRSRPRMHYDDEDDDDEDILTIPRMNHSVSIVGNNLCIFGGCESNSNVLMIDNFIRDAQRINDKYYSNSTTSSSSSSSSYDETNALSLSKYLFGISPNIFSSNASCNNSNNSSYRMVQCANCLILECNRFNFRTCSGCAQVQYCSKLCQKNHWKCNHRHFCSKNHIR